MDVYRVAEEAAGLNTHREGPKYLPEVHPCGSPVSPVHI